MRVLLALSLALWAAAGLAQEARSLRSLTTMEDSRGWASVGRLDVAGQGFCSAALISPDLVLTAAHCLYDGTGKPLALDRLTFRAGLRDGREEAARGIRRAAAHPGFEIASREGLAERVAFDLALLELDQPIRATRLSPYAVASAPGRGDAVAVVSYARGREDRPTLEEACEVIAVQENVLVLDCDVDFGASGAPVFATLGGAPRVVSVISAMADLDGRRVALGPVLDRELLVVSRTLDSVTAEAVRRIGSGAATGSSGAKFVRPGD